MFKQVACTAILAAGFFMISATQRMDDPFPCPECEPNSGNGPITAAATLPDMRSDDPFPCPECEPNSGNGPIVAAADKRMDDPFPCPECEPNSGNGPIASFACKG
jgi:hypothetical protein